MRRGVVVAVMCAALVAMASANASAQQRAPAGQQPPKPTPREQILDRLRSMSTTERPDTTAPDTTGRDTTGAQRPVRRDTTQVAVPAAAGVERDSVMQRLLQIPGFTPTEYAGARAQFMADSGVLYVTGDTVRKATVTREGQTIVADSLLTFNRNTEVACGYGKPVLTGPDAEAPLTSRLVCFNTQTQVGMALGAQTQISEGANWIARGDLATRGQNVYMHDAAFTDCNLEVPHYHFSAGSMKVVNRDVLVARNVTLNFGDVPVFWLPFMMQSLKQGRRSGVLMPRFSINDIVRRNSRYNRRIEDIGFYWAVSDFFGTEVALDWYSNNYTALRGSFDYRWLEHFFDGGLTYRQFWRQSGGQELTLSTYNSWEPTERTRLNVSANYASSGDFVRDNTFDPRELTRSIDSNAGVGHRFGWGSVNASASRRQFLGDNRVEMTLPQASLNLNPVTLFPELTNPRWYNNITWTGNGQTRYTSSTVGLNVRERDHDNIQTSAQTSLNMGSLSLGSSFDLQRQNNADREGFIRRDEQTGEVIDTVPALANDFTQRVNWNTSLGYQQRLIGTSTITPSLSIGGGFLSSTVADTAAGTGTGGRSIAAPLRLSFRTDLKTDLFGFWPGIGPLEQIRHRFSPSFGYSYSPSTTVDTIQERVFNATETREQNALTISLNQTFEGKLRRNRTQAPDSLGADSLAADTTSLDPSKPRRMQQGDKIMILGLNTSALVYDFVAAREDGRGVQTLQISNTVTSDLLRGLSLSFSHDLYRRNLDSTGVEVSRSFAPFLSQLNASFSLNSSSAIFRKLGLAGGDDAPVETGTTPTPVPEENQAGPAIDRSRDELGLVGTRRRELVQTPRGAVGSWNASFNFSLARQREPVPNNPFDNSQMLNVTLNFQPTENWNVFWRTDYSLSQGDFQDHILTFTRQLHDWDANFDFVKAQNGNFSFQFRVQLRANPDIKFDYEQRDNVRSSF